jgi:hypothetical protein
MPVTSYVISRRSRMSSRRTLSSLSKQLAYFENFSMPRTLVRVCARRSTISLTPTAAARLKTTSPV